MLDKPIPMKLTKLNIVRACSVFGHAVGSKQISLSKYSGEGCEVQLVTCLCKKKQYLQALYVYGARTGLRTCPEKKKFLL